mmetsp:Transcript_56139/g.93569  ORF Transcript_56139/g.93569 Transcript_56139/m.93569 type:complete len:81 (-) Transcript_56139:7-249(-)
MHCKWNEWSQASSVEASHLAMASKHMQHILAFFLLLLHEVMVCDLLLRRGGGVRYSLLHLRRCFGLATLQRADMTKTAPF